MFWYSKTVSLRRFFEHPKDMLELIIKKNKHSFTLKISIPLPLFEFRIDDSVGESLPADTDTFKYTVTLELVEYESSVNKTWNKKT